MWATPHRIAIRSAKLTFLQEEAHRLRLPRVLRALVSSGEFSAHRWRLLSCLEQGKTEDALQPSSG